jgi:hypothetical protein
MPNSKFRISWDTLGKSKILLYIYHSIFTLRTFRSIYDIIVSIVLYSI